MILFNSISRVCNLVIDISFVCVCVCVFMCASVCVCVCVCVWLIVWLYVCVYVCLLRIIIVIYSLAGLCVTSNSISLS